MSDPMAPGPAAAGYECFAGRGEMAARMRSFGWASTPLGPVEGWPQSLKTAVRIMLTSRYAMWMAWGPELTFFCNDAYRPTLGIKAGWALGAPAARVWAEIWPDIGPRVDRVLETGEATWDEGLLLYLERSGYPEETYHTFSYSPLADDGGAVRGMLCVVTEETERVIGERRLKALRDLGAQATRAKTAEEAGRLVASALGQATADVPFCLVYLLEPDAEAARLCGVSGLARGARASPERINLAEGGGTPPPWPIAEAIRTGRPVHVADIRSRLDDPLGPTGDGAPGGAVVLPLLEASQGRPSAFLVAGLSPARAFDDSYRGFLDLVAGQAAAALSGAVAYEQERGRAEALAELDRAKTAFFSNVSHEFRTPLTLMLGPAEEALAEASTPAQRERLEVLHRNALRLQKLVNALLDFSRIESGRVRASYEPTDLAALTEELASVFRSAVEKAGMRLSVECRPLPRPAYVDRDMWEKVVLNLVSNAFKFTLEGEIAVRLDVGPEGGARLVVRDTGSGIAEGELPHVFERFHRVEGARARTHEGTGIGLALVQELVKLHGGTVAVESALGRGTAFTVTIPFGPSHLPPDRVAGPGAGAPGASRALAYTAEASRWIADADADADADGDAGPVPDDPPASPGGPGAPPRPRIVLADDNADMRGYVRRLLEARYEVEEAADGEAALAAARARHPDLVLTDVMMPRLDGFGLLRALRDDPATARVPIIMLSARAGEEARVEGIGSGADDYLIKPFAARELLARVSAHIELARARRQAAAADERAAMLLESITDAFLALDSGMRFTYMNAEAERLNGVGRGELIGKGHREAFPEPAGSAVDREFRRALAEKVSVEFEHYHAPYRKWFGIRAYPARDGGLSVFFRDITARKRDGAVFRQQKDVLERIARGSDLAGVLDALCRMVEGHSVGGVSASVLLVDEGGARLRHGAAPSLPRAYNRAVDGIRIGPDVGSCGTAAFLGEPVLAADIATDPRWADFAGLALAHGLRSCWSQPILSRGGEVLATFALYYDRPREPDPDDLRLVELVTRTAAVAIERKRDEAERERLLGTLKNERARLAAVIEQAPAFICTLRGPEHVFELANGQYARLAGDREVLGKPVREALPEVEGQGYFERLDEVYRTGESFAGTEMPVLLRRREGGPLERRFVNFVYQATREADGAISGIFVHGVDVTDGVLAREAVAASEARFRRLADANIEGIGIVFWALDGSLPLANDAFLEVVGYTREDFEAGRVRWDTLTPPGLAGQDEPRLELLRSSGTCPPFEKEYLRKDGGLVPTLVICASFEEGGGDEGIAFIIDLTGQKRAERALRRSEGRLRFLAGLDAELQPVTDPAEVTAVAARVLGEHLGVDRCAYAEVGPDEDRFDLTGNYTRGVRSIVGRYALSDFGAEATRLMRANEPYVVDDVDRDPRAVESLAAYRATQIRAVVCVPLHKAGRLVAAMAVHQATPRAWAAEEVELVRLVAARCWESLERARVARSLRESEERFRAFMDNSPAPAWMTDADGRMVYLSETYLRTFLLPEGGLIGRSVYDLYPEGIAREYVENIRAAATSGGPIEAIEPGVHRDGSDGSFLVYRFPIVAGGEALVGGVAVDITERARAEAALRENDRRKDEFLAMLAHELRNPLAAVGNAVTVLRMSDDVEDVAFAKDVIDRQVGQLTRLIDDLLDVSRINSGKIRLKLELVDAGPILRQALESVRPLADERKHLLVAEFAGGDLPLRADPTRVEQIVVNLLTNAAKYTEDGGRIVLRASREGDQVVITVRDNGMGIPPERLPEMFQLFAQGERSIARSEGGLGIGLTIVQRLAELHGGSVTAASRGPGTGSEFTVRLPAAPGAKAEAAIEAAPAASRGGARILVVDDNVDTARGLARLLKLLGNVVRVAHDGPSAIEAAGAFRPEFVLLDIGLPGMDGYQVAAGLRRDECCKDAVVIAVSGYGQEEDRRRSRAAGFDHHLVKPVNFDALVELLGGPR